MILLEVKEYIKQRGMVNLQDLSLHFRRDPEMMRDLLAHWIRKGVVCRGEKPAGCGVRCQQCKPSIAEVYCYSE